VLDLFPGTGTHHARQLGWMLVPMPVITFLVFFLTYPFLWPAPIDRTWSLFEFRREEMANQARIWPQASVGNRLDALERTWTMLEHRFSATGALWGNVAGLFGRDAGRGGIDVPFAVAGLLILVVLAWRRGITSPTFAAMVMAGGQGALILGGLQVDFDRYYLPIVFIFSLGFGVFAGAIWWALGRLLRRGGDALAARSARTAAVAPGPSLVAQPSTPRER
jgi:hypothetical protein